MAINSVTFFLKEVDKLIGNLLLKFLTLAMERKTFMIFLSGK